MLNYLRSWFDMKSKIYYDSENTLQDNNNKYSVFLQPGCFNVINIRTLFSFLP